MREWARRNRDKIRVYRQLTADKRNAARRTLYASDPNRRKQAVQSAKKWRQQNPDKHFANRLKPFGITPDIYYAILNAQGGGCGICGAKQRRFHVDHCHATGRVRGLLCSECNLGLGKFKDNPKTLESAAMYLRAAKRKARSCK